MHACMGHQRAMYSVAIHTYTMGILFLLYCQPSQNLILRVVYSSTLAGKYMHYLFDKHLSYMYHEDTCIIYDHPTS